MMQRKRRAIVLTLALCALIASVFWAYRPAPIPPELALQGPIDRILVEKSLRKMTVFRDGVALKTYDIDLGFTPVGAKSVEGDGRTPEGIFRIDRRNANSKFHLSLGLDYPQAEHRRAAQAAGVSAGGDIMIHGLPNLLPAGLSMPPDWTAGCIAVTNAEIEELFAATAIGTEVEIRP
jgi:murein L,D-transpeptidase YafK